MHAWRRRWPASPLNRMRLVAYAVVVVGDLGNTVTALRSATPAPWPFVAAASILLLLGVLSLTYWGKPTPAEPVVVPLLAMLAGAGMGGGQHFVMAVAMPAYAALSLYGSNRDWLIRTGLGLATVPVAVALGPSTGSWHSATTLGLIPFILPAPLVMRSVYLVFRQQRVVAGRDALPATAGPRILAATRPDEVYRCPPRPSTRSAAWSTRSGSVRSACAAGPSWNTGPSTTT